MPRELSSWSLEMLSLRDRIQSVEKLLGGVPDWHNIGHVAFPFWPEIVGIDAPDEAWKWVKGFIDDAQENDHPCHSYQRALMRRYG